MIEMNKIHDFAVKWLNKFKDKSISYKELTSHHMGEECSELGFQVYCGHILTEKYGNINDPKIFKEILKDITDINLLGSTIYSKWNYFYTWAYNAAEILEEKNHKWFILALEHLAKLSEAKPYGDIKKVKIISNKVSSEHYIFNPEDEIQQSLTIESDGHIWFSAYTSEKRKDGKYKKNRMHNFRINPSVAEKIISDISSYLCYYDIIENYETAEYPMWTVEIINLAENIISDISSYLCYYDITENYETAEYPMWTVEIINQEGKIYKFNNHFIFIDDVNHEEYISNKIRRALKIPDLFLFDGKFEEDIIDRVVVDYHRITKINTKRAFDKEKKPFNWNYTEKLIVDRETKTIEHI